VNRNRCHHMYAQALSNVHAMVQIGYARARAHPSFSLSV